jgi:hypothetical protein
MMISPNVKIGRRVDSPHSKSKSSTRSETNIQISNIVGSIPSEPLTTSDPVVLATPPDNVIDSLTQIQLPSELKTSEPTSDNPEFKRFRFRAADQLELVADVNFLRHVIKTLISNHHITTDIKDLNDVLNYYGDVDIKTDKQVVQHRGIKKKGMCSDVDADEVIEIVEKVLVNSVNIMKKLPDFVQFLSSLGLNL